MNTGKEDEAARRESKDPMDKAVHGTTTMLTQQNLQKLHTSVPSLDRDLKFPASRVSDDSIDEAVKDADYVNVVGLKSHKARNKMASSSLNDGDYDMIDEVFESGVDDDQDTVSLASTEHEIEGILTPQEEEPGNEGPDKIEFDFPDSLLSLQDRSAAASPAPGDKDAHGDKDDQGLVRSISSDDMETPRQSMVHRPPYTLSASPDNKVQGKHEKDNNNRQRNKSTLKLILDVLFVGISVIGVSILATKSFNELAPVRADALTTALDKLSNANFSSKLNHTHLTSWPLASSYGQMLATTNEVRYEVAVEECMFIVSLPKVSRFRYPSPSIVDVYRGDSHVLSNATKLIEGIYAITINKKDCHGRIKVEITTKNPALSSTLSHNFGNRMLYRQVYTHASTELSTQMAKDVAFVQGIGGSIKSELTAGVRATTNVTKALAIRAGSGLSSTAFHAADTICAATQAGSQTASLLTNSMITMHRGVLKYSNNLRNNVANTTFQQLKLSSERAQALSVKIGLRKPKQHAQVATDRKDLSLRMQDSMSVFFADCGKMLPKGNSRLYSKQVRKTPEQQLKADRHRRIIATRQEQHGKRASNRDVAAKGKPCLGAPKKSNGKGHTWWRET